MHNNQFVSVLGEAGFIKEAARHKIVVLSPEIEGGGYDKMTDCNGCIKRSQIKTTGENPARSYTIPFYTRPGCYRPRRSIPYTPKECDVISAFIVCEEVWYHFPVEIVAEIGGPNPSARVQPHNPNEEYARYKNAWWLFQKNPPQLVNLLEYGSRDIASVFYGIDDILETPLFKPKGISTQRAYREWLLRELGEGNRRLQSALDDIREDTVLGVIGDPTRGHDQVVREVWQWWKASEKTRE
jgi:hypothetical protein